MSDTLQFGLTMLAVGMVGTILTLVFVAGIIRLLTAIFPPGDKMPEGGGGKENTP